MEVPLQSLYDGTWFKLICGASSQHIPTIRSCAVAYAIAGADCIDLAADPAIVVAVKEAIVAIQPDYPNVNPWLMVSLNDGEDPHFRKAEFDPETCFRDCDRPCEKVCPTDAIKFLPNFSGVVDALCYGCGRCLPICPIQTIKARPYVYTPEVIVPMMLELGIDAIEIHTQIGRIEGFTRLWQTIKPKIHQLKLIAVSCPNGPGMVQYLQDLSQILSSPTDPLSCALIWQTDGRPMSGDIGDGATRACIHLGQTVLALDLPGFVQLAGGTNDHTVPKLMQLGLFPPKGDRHLSGIAYGSYARSQLQPVLQQLESLGINRLEESPDLLEESVKIASRLTAALKRERSQKI